MAGDLHHAPVGREAAAQDHEAAARLEGVVERTDHVLPLGLLRRLGLLADGPAAHRGSVGLQQAGAGLEGDGGPAGFLKQLAHHATHAVAAGAGFRAVIVVDADESLGARQPRRQQRIVTGQAGDSQIVAALGCAWQSGGDAGFLALHSIRTVLAAVHLARTLNPSDLRGTRIPSLSRAEVNL